MKYLLIPLILFPITSFAWTRPQLESLCGNYINITLGAESNYIVEFSGTPTFDTITRVDFVHAGSHAMHMPIDGTLYARFASDTKVQTSVEVMDCNLKEAPADSKKKSNRNMRKHGYIRRTLPVNPMPAVLPLFDLPLFDYPSEPVIKFNLKD